MVVLSLEQKAQIWDAYQRKTPHPGQAFTDWATRTAKHYKCGVGTIRTIVTKQREAIDLHLEHQSHTQAQALAASMGLSMVDVFKTIKRNLHATRRELVYVEKIVKADEPEDFSDTTETEGEREYEGGSAEFSRPNEKSREKSTKSRSGKRTRAIRLREAARDDKGNFVYFEQADPRAQLEAAKQLGSILGANAPEELALNVKHQHTIDLTDEELARELAAAAEGFARFQTLTVEAERIPEALGGGTRKTRSKRLPLLDAALHQDGGRAGRDGESGEAVPEQAVFQAGAPNIGERDNDLHREVSNDDAFVDRSGLGDAQDGDAGSDGDFGPV